MQRIRDKNIQYKMISLTVSSTYWAISGWIHFYTLPTENHVAHICFLNKSLQVIETNHWKSFKTYQCNYTVIWLLGNSPQKPRNSTYMPSFLESHNVKWLLFYWLCEVSKVIGISCVFSNVIWPSTSGVQLSPITISHIALSRLDHPGEVVKRFPLFWKMKNLPNIHGFWKKHYHSMERIVIQIFDSVS